MARFSVPMWRWRIFPVREWVTGNWNTLRVQGDGIATSNFSEFDFTQLPVRAFYPCLQLLSVEAFFYHTPVLSWQMLSVRKLCQLIRKLPCRGVWEIEDAGRRPCQHPQVPVGALPRHRGWCFNKSWHCNNIDWQELNVEVSVFATKPIILHGVKLKESAFRELDLPIRWVFVSGWNAILDGCNWKKYCSNITMI